MVLLSDFADDERSETRSGSTSQRVSQLEALQTVALLRLPPHDLHDVVHQLGAICVVTLGPVVGCTSSTRYEVVWSVGVGWGEGSQNILFTIT